MLLTLLGALSLPAPARAVTVGLSDQNATSFADARMRALGLREARLIVPWTAATTEPARVQGWLDAVAAAGMTPHVAFEHLSTDRCPGSPCVLPTRAQYRAAVEAFRERFPQVTTFTAWNEANHASQPVATEPEAAAGYYDELVSVCPRCTVVAGDVLDSGSFVSWLRRFLAVSRRSPRLWGLQDYGDVTYGRTTGVDAVLATVPGQLWIEETGGIVTLRNAAGRETLHTDEARATLAIDRAFSIAAARPRVSRMYVYQWRAWVDDRFDAGLARPDGTLRPSYFALQRDLAALVAPAATPAPVAWSAAWSTTTPRVLVVRARCRAPSAVCAGRVRVEVRSRPAARTTWRTTVVATRSYATSAGAPRATLRITVSRALRARLRRSGARRLVLRAAPRVPAGAAATVTLALGRPR